MVVVTLMVRFKWQKEVQKLKEKILAHEAKKKEMLDVESTITAGQPVDANTVKNKIENLVLDYKESGRTIAKLHGIFEHWFLLQWVISFADITIMSVRAIQLVQTGSYSTTVWIMDGLPLLHYMFIFITPYICGNVMNHYHHKYHKKMRKVQRNIWSKYVYSTEGDMLLWLMLYKDIISKRDKIQFIPSIFCIKFPLENPGYIFAILLVLTSFLIGHIYNIELLP